MNPVPTGGAAGKYYYIANLGLICYDVFLAPKAYRCDVDKAVILKGRVELDLASHGRDADAVAILGYALDHVLEEPF